MEESMLEKLAKNTKLRVGAAIIGGLMAYEAANTYLPFAETRKSHAQQQTQYQRGTPEFYENLAKQAENFNKEGKHDAAILLLTPFEFDEQNKCDYFFNELGVAFGRKDSIDSAIGYYEKAIEINPRAVSQRNNLGNALLKLKKYSSAEVELKKALEIENANPNVHSNLGVVYFHQGRIKDSYNEFIIALEINPELKVASEWKKYLLDKYANRLK